MDDLKVLKAAMIGCGDYLRWELDTIKNSKFIQVKYTYDLDSQKAKDRAKYLGATAVRDDDVIFEDREIDVVFIFTPPWGRIPIFKKAVQTNKQIITTKPLAPNIDEATELYEMTKDKVNCAVFYGRTGDAAVEKLKEIFDSEQIGKLAFYKEDWLHHYPQWNDWATDPEKNGGPFMDAMVHNLNKVRYLMEGKIEALMFFSDNHAQKLACNDTEFMKIDFEGKTSAQLFITWAADLEVYSTEGNDREHIGIMHMISDKGWYVEDKEMDDRQVITARRGNECFKFPIEPLEHTPYDEFSIAFQQDKPQAFDIKMAWEDIKIMDRAMKNPGEWVKINV